MCEVLLMSRASRLTDLKQLKKNVKFVEDIRKWPKTMMKYPHKNNTKE
jgi:hypothetical protein